LNSEKTETKGNMYQIFKLIIKGEFMEKTIGIIAAGTILLLFLIIFIFFSSNNVSASEVLSIFG
jgi:uncharacterized integral membrane protein